MPAGVTPQGLEIKTVEQINAEIFNAQLSFLGADLDTSPDQPLGQLNGIVATKAAELWELAQVAYNAFNPNAAEGFLLDAIGLLRGTPRLLPTYSKVMLSVALDTGTTLTAGVSTANVLNQSANRWVLIDSFTAPINGTYPLAFRSENTGPFQANAGTITVITTATAGWSSVTNPSDAIPGFGLETDDDYRARQTTLLSASGSGTIDSLRADVLAIPGIRQAVVFENVGDTIDSMGLPGHSFEIVVRDEGLVDDESIAQVIWDNKPAGIATYGLTSGNAVDALGVSRLVYFSRAQAVPIYIEFEATALSGWNYGQMANIENRITEYMLGLRIGEDVVLNRIRNAIMAEPYIWDVPLVKMNTLSPAQYVIQPRQYGVPNGVDGIVVVLPEVP